MNENWKTICSSEEISDDILVELINIDQSDFPNPWTKASWESFIATQKFTIIILTIDSRIVSYAVYLNNAVDSLAHLLKIVTINAETKQGFGKMVLENSMKELSKLGFSRFFLEVEVSNEKAISLYRKLGFNAIHQKKNFYGAGKDALIMTVE